MNHCAGVPATTGVTGTSAVVSGAAIALIFTVFMIFSSWLKTLSRSICFIMPSCEATVVRFSANS